MLDQARARFGDALAEEQEILGLLADILIEVYAIESVCLRTEKLLEARSAGHRASVLEMARVYTSDAAERLAHLARSLTAGITLGEGSSKLWLALSRLAPERPADTVTGRRLISNTLIDLGRYPW
jgi:alkylation response protein AidB-like acyl-CoA dehydrogenase